MACARSARTRFTCWGQYRLSNTRFSILASESPTASSRWQQAARVKCRNKSCTNTRVLLTTIRPARTQASLAAWAENLEGEPPTTRQPLCDTLVAVRVEAALALLVVTAAGSCRARAERAAHPVHDSQAARASKLSKALFAIRFQNFAIDDKRLGVGRNLDRKASTVLAAHTPISEPFPFVGIRDAHQECRDPDTAMSDTFCEGLPPAAQAQTLAKGVGHGCVGHL